MKPCPKREVIASIITKNKEMVMGTNYITNIFVTECHRVKRGYKRGEGWHLCKDICQQPAHAEINAIREANRRGYDLKGATLFLQGHNYICDDCAKCIEGYGVAEVIIL